MAFTHPVGTVELDEAEVTAEVRGWFAQIESHLSKISTYMMAFDRGKLSPEHKRALDHMRRELTQARFLATHHPLMELW